MVITSISLKMDCFIGSNSSLEDSSSLIQQKSEYEDLVMKGANSVEIVSLYDDLGIIWCIDGCW